MKTKPHNDDMNLAIDEVIEELGIVPARTNSEWIKTLESRLTMHRKELSAMLDYAAENPSLLPECVHLRRQMQQIKARLADFRFLHEHRN